MNHQNSLADLLETTCSICEEISPATCYQHQGEGMKHIQQKEFIQIWGPMFANRVIDMAMANQSHGSVASQSHIQNVAIGELIRMVDELKAQIKRLQNDTIN